MPGEEVGGLHPDPLGLLRAGISAAMIIITPQYGVRPASVRCALCDTEANQLPWRQSSPPHVADFALSSSACVDRLVAISTASISSKTIELRSLIEGRRLRREPLRAGQSRLTQAAAYIQASDVTHSQNSACPLWVVGGGPDGARIRI